MTNVLVGQSKLLDKNQENGFAGKIKSFGVVYFTGLHQLLSPDTADGFGRHTQHGSKVLQRYLIKNLPVFLEEKMVSFLGCHGDK